MLAKSCPTNRPAAKAADAGAVRAYELLLADWGDVIERLPILSDASERLASLVGA